MDFNSFLSYLASVTVRSVGLAVLALIAVLLFRVRAAAALHAVCTVVVASMLVLAVLAPVLPPLPLRILRPEVGQVFDVPTSPPLETSAVPRPPQPAPSTHPRFSWQQISAAPASEGIAAEPTSSDIFTALQKQLGLKLEPGRGAIRQLIVDHVERPSED